MAKFKKQTESEWLYPTLQGKVSTTLDIGYQVGCQSMRYDVSKLNVCVGQKVLYVPCPDNTAMVSLDGHKWHEVPRIIFDEMSCRIDKPAILTDKTTTTFHYDKLTCEEQSYCTATARWTSATKQ